MKTQNITLAAIAILGLALTSCSEDGLTDYNLKPEVPTEKNGFAQRTGDGEEVNIISWQALEIVQPECELFNEQLTGQEDPMCDTQFGVTGQGGGYIEGLDRFLINTSLQFNSRTQIVTGTIRLEFPGLDGTLDLMPNGTYSASGDPKGEMGVAIYVPVETTSGTGYFENIVIDGTLMITEANAIFDTDRTEYHATILIDGQMTK